MRPCCTWWMLNSSLLFSQLIKDYHPPITLLTNTVVFLLRRGEGTSRLSCTVTKWGGPCASSQYTVMCGIKRRHYRDLWRWPLWWDHVTMALVMRSRDDGPCGEITWQWPLWWGHKNRGFVSEQLWHDIYTPVPGHGQKMPCTTLLPFIGAVASPDEWNISAGRQSTH